MAPIDSYGSSNNYIFVFDGTLNIISVCSIVLMTVGVLGIKFKWFRARMTFSNKEPTNRNAVVGVYKQNFDSEFSSNYTETVTSNMYTLVDHSNTPIQKKEPKTFTTKDERINNKYFNTNVTKVNFDDVLTELNSIKPPTAATTSKTNDIDDNDSGYLNEINPSYFETNNVDYLTVLDNDLPPELPKTAPPKFDDSYLEPRSIFEATNSKYDTDDIELYLPKNPPTKKKKSQKVEFKEENDEDLPTFEFVKKSNQSLVVNQNDLSEQYTSTAANIFLPAVKNSPAFKKKNDDRVGFSPAFKKKNDDRAGISPAFNKRSVKQNGPITKQSTPLSNSRSLQMNSNNDDNLSISSGTSA